MTELPIEEIDAGMHKCLENSSELLNDANILLEKKRYATAFALFQLGIEESAKVKILLRLALEKRSGIVLMDLDRKQYFNSMFNNHKEKNRLMGYTDQNFNELAKRINIPEFRDSKSIKRDINHPSEQDKLKQSALYVSVESQKFVKPSDKISREDCTEKKEIAVFRFNRVQESINYYLNNTEFFVAKFKRGLLSGKEK